VTITFKGEKTTLFWIGLIVLGYAILQFCQAIWQTIYYYFVYPGLLGVSSEISYLSFTRLFTILLVVVPSVIGGIIFTIIGLYIMKAGVKKHQTPNPKADSNTALLE
jgi:hypothetical protein